MCFDNKMVDDPKRSSSIEFLQGEYCFCLARLCMTRYCRTCYLTTLRLFPECMSPDLRQSRQVSYPERRSPDLIPDVCADVPLGLGPGIHPSGAAVRSGERRRN